MSNYEMTPHNKSASPPYPYSKRPTGLYQLVPTKDGDAEEEWLCSDLLVLGTGSDSNGKSWGRLSTRKQADENLSLEVQEERIRSFVENTTKATLSLHVETQSASKSSAHRFVLHAALEEARTTQGTLVVVRIDRLSRNLDVLPFLKGVRIYSLDQGRVTPGQLKELITEAARESKAISEGARAAAAERRAKGQKLGNRSTLHIAQRNGCVRNKARADKKVHDLADIFRTHPWLLSLTHKDLSQSLNDMGFLNQTNRSERFPWTKSSIRAPRVKATQMLTRT